MAASSEAIGQAHQYPPEGIQLCDEKESLYIRYSAFSSSFIGDGRASQRNLGC